MKKIILFVLMICFGNCFSQITNPLLFQTWYLTDVQVNDMSPAYHVSYINPRISPSLTISNTLHFDGTGACNTFSGVFSNAIVDWIVTIQFEKTSLVCDLQIYNDFESSYFAFMQYANCQYHIDATSFGMFLTLTNPLSGSASFTTVAPLNVTDFELEKIAVYPNPAKSKIYVNPGDNVISKVTVTNICGQMVKEIDGDFEAIDITDLASGIYMVKIDTEEGTINKKIIKE